MNSRGIILDAIRAGRGNTLPMPRFAAGLGMPSVGDFTRKATATLAQVRELSARDDVPETVMAILAEASVAPRLHLPRDSELHQLPWHRAPGLTVINNAPTGSDTALSEADYAIAETGTLAFFSEPAKPSSWHFLPGREIALVRRSGILPRLEDVLVRAKTMPATLNLVSGPSRTGDIEQTMELGAHGPSEIHILIVP